MKTRTSTPAIACVLASAATVLGVQERASAAINLELRPTFQSVILGNSFTVDIYAVSDNPLIGQSTSAMQAIITWDTAFVQLTGVDNGTSPMFVSSFIPGDPYGLNASITDGDALWTGLATPGVPIQATPAGTYLTSFDFVALNLTLPTTFIDIAEDGGLGGETIVWDGITPNLPVTGTLAGATVEVTPVPVPGVLGLFALASMFPGRRRK